MKCKDCYQHLETAREQALDTCSWCEEKPAAPVYPAFVKARFNDPLVNGMVRQGSALEEIIGQMYERHRETMARLMEAARVAVYPSLRVEGTPLACLEEARKEIERLESELADIESVFALQRTRCGAAQRAWQAAHNQPNVFPDLGVLLEWLMEGREG